MPDEYPGVPVVPELDEDAELERDSFDMTEDQKKNAEFVSRRLNLMDQEKQKFMPRKRMALALFDGVINDGLWAYDDSERLKARVVSPLARTFVESKTAEEVKVYTEAVLFPVDDEQDSWRAELLMQTIEHVNRVTYAKAKRQELLRMKNIIGVSVEYKGYKNSSVKMNITKTADLNGMPLTWEVVDVPGDNEIVMEVVDPIHDFWIDPAATGAHDALDCARRFRMNHEEAVEIFGGDMFDMEGVGAGADGMVEGIMYFKKPSARPDMFAIYAWPSMGLGVRGMEVGHVKEVYFGGLPDEHKMLPFVTRVNVPTFTYGFFGEVTRSESGEAATPSGNVVAIQKFWAYAGDPEIIMDLVDLRTDFGRSLYKATDLAGRSFTATKGSFRIDNSIDWEHGDQIPGGMGKIQTGTWGVGSIPSIQVTLDDLFSQMIQVLGTDPRNLTDTKQKTLGETIAQRESQFTRLEAIMDYNQEISEVRDVTLTHMLIQQWYSIPKVVTLTGLETEEELEKFDEVEGEHPKTGGALFGHQYRRIRTDKPMKEILKKKSKDGKGTEEFKLTSSDSGTFSFVSRPQYIRVSDMDIAVVTKRRAGELQALKAQQLGEALTKYVELLPFTQTGQNGEPPAIDPDALPPVNDLLKEQWKVLGISGKDKVEGASEKKIEELQEIRREAKSKRKPISDVVPVAGVASLPNAPTSPGGPPSTVPPPAT